MAKPACTAPFIAHHSPFAFHDSPRPSTWFGQAFTIHVSFPYIHTMKKILLYPMSLLYIAAGTNHFLHPAMYLGIMPPYLPWPAALVNISGVAEILLGLLLLPLATRRLAAIGIIFLLIAVFPANVQMAINYAHEHNPNLWLSIVRLPLQIVLVWWAALYAGKVNARPK